MVAEAIGDHGVQLSESESKALASLLQKLRDRSNPGLAEND